jgi:hypothetical protein
MNGSRFQISDWDSHGSIFSLAQSGGEDSAEESSLDGMA